MCVCVNIALNQPASNMYHDMGYPSHSYANYLAQYESNTYGDATHFMHHLSTVPVGSQLPIPPPPPPPLPSQQPHPLSSPYTTDALHQHQHLAIMHMPENRTWYQPPICVTPHSDHRYCSQHTKETNKQTLISFQFGQILQITIRCHQIHRTGIERNK